MATGKRWSPWLAAVLVAAACGGGEEAPPAGQPAEEPPPPTAAVQDTSARDSTGQALALSREVFTYSGSGRDPFLSLLRSGDMRPLPGDRRVVGITYDTRYPQRSVAVLIRELLGKGQSAKYLMEAGVEGYIERNGLYRKRPGKGSADAAPPLTEE